MLKLRDGEFELVRNLVKDMTGVSMEEGKAYLVESRLSPIAETFGCESFNELYLRVRREPKGELAQRFVDAITTHETLFFRDEGPFEALQHKAIPELIDARSSTLYPKQIRIWCAACSTGQEPYSVAMVLHELIPDIASWNVAILATDISKVSVEQAREGVYTKLEMSRCSKPEVLKKYFTEVESGWRASNRIRNLIRFETRNLLDPFTGIGPFDIILCRNVSIYFERGDRDQLFRRQKLLLPEDGYLFTGSSENLMDLGPEFQPQTHCRSTFYCPNLPLSVS